MAKYFNISGELTQQLLAPGDEVDVSKILLTNIQKVSECKVDLYIERAIGSKFYLIKGVELPIGSTLVYDASSFNTDVNGFGLYIKLTDGASFTMTGSVDVTGANTAVPGTGTIFTSELSIGDEIEITGETRIIDNITSDTAATVSVAFGSDLANDTTVICNPTALVDVIIN